MHVAHVVLAGGPEAEHVCEHEAVGRLVGERGGDAQLVGVVESPAGEVAAARGAAVLVAGCGQAHAGLQAAGHEALVVDRAAPAAEGCGGGGRGVRAADVCVSCAVRGSARTIALRQHPPARAHVREPRGEQRDPLPELRRHAQLVRVVRPPAQQQPCRRRARMRPARGQRHHHVLALLVDLVPPFPHFRRHLHLRIVVPSPTLGHSVFARTRVLLPGRQQFDPTLQLGLLRAEVCLSLLTLPPALQSIVTGVNDLPGAVEVVAVVQAAVDAGAGVTLPQSEQVDPVLQHRRHCALALVTPAPAEEPRKNAARVARVDALAVETGASVRPAALDEREPVQQQLLRHLGLRPVVAAPARHDGLGQVDDAAAGVVVARRQVREHDRLVLEHLQVRLLQHVHAFVAELHLVRQFAVLRRLPVECQVAQVQPQSVRTVY